MKIAPHPASSSRPPRAARSLRLRTQRAFSSGGVIIRQRQGVPAVCLITLRDSGRRVWGLPKGHAEAGEAPRMTALREVAEETGLRGEVVTWLGAIVYWFVVRGTQPRQRRHGRHVGIRYLKTVSFYLLRYVSGSPRRHDQEVEAARWMPLAKAMARVTYDNERRILMKAQRYLTTHPEAFARRA